MISFTVESMYAIDPHTGDVEGHTGVVAPLRPYGSNGHAVDRASLTDIDQQPFWALGPGKNTFAVFGRSHNGRREREHGLVVINRAVAGLAVALATPELVLRNPDLMTGVLARSLAKLAIDDVHCFDIEELVANVRARHASMDWRSIETK